MAVIEIALLSNSRQELFPRTCPRGIVPVKGFDETAVQLKAIWISLLFY